MTDDVRISVGLSGHPKTRKLKRRLGAGACWSLVVLFLWTGAERWDGTLYGMTDEDIELAADWDGAPGAFVSALLEVGFLDGDANLRAIHDWKEHNPYAASKGERIEKGKQAAAARWNRKPRQIKADDATSMPTACCEHAFLAVEQCPPAPTPTQPVKAKAKEKATVRQVAQCDRFDDFWRVYPNKQGKQEARKRWERDKLDGMADSIIAHVILMTGNDDGWLRGFVPMGSTYLNQARWTDVPRSAPIQASQQPGKQMQGLIALEGMKNGLVPSRNHHGNSETGRTGLGSPAVRRSFAGDGFGLVGSTGQRIALGHGNGRPEDSRGVLDLGPDGYVMAESATDD